MTEWDTLFEEGAEKLEKLNNSNPAVYDKLKSGQQKQAQLVDRGTITIRGSDQIVIEDISQDEVYLVDRDLIRGKRICGAIVANKQRTRKLCQNVAGLFTNHKNFGRCRKHERGNDKTIFDRFIKASQKSGDLVSYYDAARKIPDDEIENLYTQAR